MRIRSQTKALEQLQAVTDDLRAKVADYERRANSCATCDTPGACCLDEHFVNVRISRLEAVAITNVIDQLPPIRRAAVEERIFNTASKLNKHNDAHMPTFACPLYEKATGCLVHHEAKPVPCIIHACYDSQEDYPPDSLQDAAELAIDRLNHRTYSKAAPLAPLPIALSKLVLTADG